MTHLPPTMVRIVLMKSRRVGKTEAMLRSTKTHDKTPPDATSPPFRPLTPAQFRVVALLYHKQLDYPGAADVLGCAIRTVRMHVEHIARRLPGKGPPAWKVLRHAEALLERGFSTEDWRGSLDE